MSTLALLAQQVFAPLGGGAMRSESYVAVPGGTNPRWLLPAREFEVTELDWTPYRWHSRLAWKGVCAAGRMGCLAHIPGLSSFDVKHACDMEWRAIGWQWSGDPLVAVYVGTPGQRRKAALHLVEQASGKCRLVVKVPLTAEAKASLLHEAEALRQLEQCGYPHSPHLVHAQQESGVTTQSFVEGRHGSRKLTADTWRLLRSLVIPGKCTTTQRHVQRSMEVMHNEGADPCVRTAVEELQDDRLLPACWVHGDFAPWNIRSKTDGGCALIDWEEAQADGLPLQDAFHFLHAQDFLFRRKPTTHVALLAQPAKAMDLPVAVVRKLELAYLVEAYATCVAEARNDRKRFVIRALKCSLGYEA